IDPAPARGASHAAAGMLAPAAEVVWGQTSLYPLLRPAAEMHPEFAAEVAGAADAALGRRDAGTSEWGGDRADLPARPERRAAQLGAGCSTELITATRARELEPSLSPSVAGAVRIPEDQSIDPRRVTSALLSVFASELISQHVSGLVREGGATVGVELA